MTNMDLSDGNVVDNVDQSNTQLVGKKVQWKSRPSNNNNSVQGPNKMNIVSKTKNEDE